MKITTPLSDEVVLRELGRRLVGVRLERNLTQAALAEQAGISKRAVERMERGEVAMRLSGFVRVCRALGLVERFDALIPEPMPSPITQLKLKGKERRRASGKKAVANASKKWTWGPA
ncbi:MAG: helix-turn-helix transcriptional regulator [Verrucomicrobiae bacterium]|nr:helix-turn-helix transcriptional regulator [Verrucomicrobiae bacterium]